MGADRYVPTQMYEHMKNLSIKCTIDNSFIDMGVLLEVKS